MDTRDVGVRPEAIRAEVLVLFHAEDEPAPRGRLGRLDWILLSPLARLRARGKFTGAKGTSALLVPDRKVKAQRILVIGVGRRAECSRTALYRLSYDAARAVLGLGCRHIALDLPVRLFSYEPPDAIRRAFFEGFAAEMRRGRPGVDFDVSILPASGV
ncbi:MAG: hypothetical protein EHM71_03965 [Zetaproteobacteria bacterium]|nr:MAG: hypothetical protein EHM71_03965 [Zetaproteobacteria bacterium]